MKALSKIEGLGLKDRETPEGEGGFSMSPYDIRIRGGLGCNRSNKTISGVLYHTLSESPVSHLYAQVGRSVGPYADPRLSAICRQQFPKGYMHRVIRTNSSLIERYYPLPKISPL